MDNLYVLLKFEIIHTVMVLYYTNDQQSIHPIINAHKQNPNKQAKQKCNKQLLWQKQLYHVTQLKMLLLFLCRRA